MPGYNVFRKDRTHAAGGGVCMYIHESIPCKQLVDCIEEPVEALWILLRPQKLPRNVTCIIAVVVYHTTSNREPENLKLKDHIQRNLDNLLRKYPNALIVITGDFNPNSTGLKHTYLTSPNNLKQLVTFNTRESNILDWFLTNRIKQFTIHQLPKIASSDHYTILAKPISINTNDKENKKVKRRDMKDSNWRAFGRWMTTKDWTAVLQKTTCEDKFQLFLSELKEGIDFYLPEKTVIIHQNDRPWMTKELKSMIKKRQTAFTKHGKNSRQYKRWRNKVQKKIKGAKVAYYKHKISNLEQYKSKKWWKGLKSLTGQDIKQEWYHQFLCDDLDMKSLTNKINDMFLSITEDFQPLPPLKGKTQVPTDLLATVEEVQLALKQIKVCKSVGPDNIPNIVLKEFAPELAIVIQDIYNQSLIESYVPQLLRCSIISPIPKETPPQSMETDLRPISLTCTLAKVMEDLFCKRFLPQLEGKVDKYQFARKGMSTTDALISFLQPIFEAIDKGDNIARIFFTDFSKGFDRVDHNVLMANLQKLNVHPALSNWVSAFLSNRMQATRIAGVLSDWKSPNGGIPQGTKLGVILFSVMTNELLVDWNLRTKFVDDTTALEIIPRNSTSLMNIVAENVNEFAEKNRMKLNPRKCKEMVIDPLEYNTTVLRPITIGNTTIEKVKKYKLLGVILTADLKWKEHIAYIYGKACKRLYSLRVLRKAGVEEKNMLKVYLAIIRPILEYAVPVWQAIPEYLSQKIESVQKRALKIIKPGEESYEELLRVFNVEKLQPRREKLCRQYMGKIKSPNHQLNTLIPQQVDREHEYNLRNDNNRNFYLFNNRPYCRTKLCGDFFTFKYY